MFPKNGRFLLNLWRKIDTDTTGDLSVYGGCLSVFFGRLQVLIIMIPIAHFQTMPIVILGSYQYRISVFQGISQSRPHLSFLWSQSLASAHSGVATPPDRGRCGACASTGGFKNLKSRTQMATSSTIWNGLRPLNDCMEVYGGFSKWSTSRTIGSQLKND